MNQESSYRKLFAMIPEGLPSSGLAPAIESRIRRSRAVRARIHAGLHGALLIAAVTAFVPAVNGLMADAANSGFSAYISLVSSDGAAVLGHWRSFMLSVIETAPIFEIGFILALAMVFANSLRRGARYVPSIYYPIN
jgi:hypothetical protein